MRTIVVALFLLGFVNYAQAQMTSTDSLYCETIIQSLTHKSTTTQWVVIEQQQFIDHRKVWLTFGKHELIINTEFKSHRWVRDDIILIYDGTYVPLNTRLKKRLLNSALDVWGFWIQREREKSEEYERDAEERRQVKLVKAVKELKGGD